MAGFIRIKRRRYRLFQQRLEYFARTKIVTTTEIIRKSALIVITGGTFSHPSCQLENAFKKREFSGSMENIRKEWYQKCTLLE